MPRIKAYKGNRAIIPVDVAKVSTAYRCPFTEALFNTKRQYVTHLKDLRKTRMHAMARKARHRRLRDDLNNQPTFEKIIEWANNHPEFFFDNAMLHDPFERDSKNYAAKRLEFEFKITELSLRWSPHVSNTHDAPYNGVTNWGHYKEDAPTGYPGWQGRISYKMTSINTFASRVLENTGINTGTGGGGGDNTYSYGVIFFDNDWPNITGRREKYNTAHQLGGPAFEWFKYTNGKVHT